MKKSLGILAIFIPFFLVLLSFLTPRQEANFTMVNADNNPQVVAEKVPVGNTPIITETKLEPPKEVAAAQITPTNSPASTIIPKVTAAPVKSVPAPQPIVAPIPTPVPPPTLPSPQPAPASCDAGNFNAQFLCLINNHRKSNSLNALSYDAALNVVATTHSTWMNTNATMSHTGENGSQINDRCKTGLTSCDAENIAQGYTTAQKLFDAWKKSPGHDANMLGSHTKIGLSLVGTYSTLIFR